MRFTDLDDLVVRNFSLDVAAHRVELGHDGGRATAGDAGRPGKPLHPRVFAGSLAPSKVKANPSTDSYRMGGCASGTSLKLRWASCS